MTALVLQVDTKNWLERAEKKNKVYSTKRTIGKSLFVEHRSFVCNVQHSVLIITSSFFKLSLPDRLQRTNFGPN